MGNQHWIQASDTVVLEHLRAELQRLSDADSALVALGCESHDEIRATFLSATKAFHPSRFARRPVEIRTLASDVYVRVKKAYERARTEAAALSLAEKRSSLASPKRPSPSPENVDPTKRTTKSLSMSADREELRNRRRNRLQNRLSAQLTGGDGTPGAAGTQSGEGPKKREAEVRAATDVKRAEEESLKEQESAFLEALQALKSGDFGKAAAEFKAVAIARPSERRYRVHMHYAQGRALQVSGRLDAARIEYKRCLGLDSSFTLGQDAMAGLPKDGRKKSGLISKLFGK